MMSSTVSALNIYGSAGLNASFVSLTNPRMSVSAVCWSSGSHLAAHPASQSGDSDAPEAFPDSHLAYQPLTPHFGFYMRSALVIKLPDLIIGTKTRAS